MKIITLILICLSTSIADEVYENSSRICERCSCTNIQDEFVLNCAHKQFHNVPANWPEHNSSLTATFSFNNITTLKILPITNRSAKLVFDHCFIKYVDEGVFANIPNVELIDLSYNLLTTEEIDGQDFKGPYNNSKFYPIAVKHLNLAYNQIHSLPRKFFENMPQLEELNLAGNDFTVLDVNTQLALSTLTNLRILNLADNELTELIEGAVEKLHNLMELNLSDNLLDFVPNSLGYLGKSLRILKLTNNLIYHLDDKSFLGLDLHELYLENLQRLESVKPNTFTSLRNLKKLALANNMNLKAIDVEAFDQKQQLYELYLNNNSLVEIKFRMLDWSSLKIFDLKDNSLECTCDLYNISSVLYENIKKHMDRPRCLDIFDGTTKFLYDLEESVCHYTRSQNHIATATQHFEYIRTVIIWVTAFSILTAIIILLVGYLRYRRGNAFKNYSFTAQVVYSPIASQQRF